jgi:hypothetical protein
MSGRFVSVDRDTLYLLPPEADPRLNPRNRCLHSGYMSPSVPLCQAGHRGHTPREQIELPGYKLATKSPETPLSLRTADSATYCNFN